jgi:hypothetical protein
MWQMWTRRILSRAAWFASGFLAAFLLISVICRYPPSFSEAQFNTLQEGMTPQEVFTLLGCPPGDYRPAIWRHPDWFVSTSDAMAFQKKEAGLSTEKLEDLERQDSEEFFAQVRAGHELPRRPRIRRFEWWGRNSGIKVIFDEDRMVHRSLWSVVPPHPPHDLLRYPQWWLGW